MSLGDLLSTATRPCSAFSLSLSLSISLTHSLRRCTRRQSTRTELTNELRRRMRDSKIILLCTSYGDHTNIGRGGGRGQQQNSIARQKYTRAGHVDTDEAMVERRGGGREEEHRGRSQRSLC